MISFNTLNINNYDQTNYIDDINALELHKVKCTCGAASKYHHHAVYQRYLMIDDGYITLSIERVKCDSCGCTHALLPSIITPYRIISNPIIVKIIQSYRYVSDSATVISKITGLSREAVTNLIKYYLSFHEERLLSFLSFFFTDDFLDYDFIYNYFTEYSVMFMQRILTKNMIMLM